MFDSGADAIIVASALINKIKNSKVDDDGGRNKVFCICYEKGLQRIKRNWILSA